MRKSLLVLVGAGALLLSGPSMAVTAFAAFTPLSSFANIEFSGTTAGVGTLSSAANAPVTFRFLDATGSTSVFDVVSSFNFSALTTGGVVAGGVGIAPVTSGSFSFTASAPTNYNGRTGTNLLSATFTGGALTGLIGGSVASYINSEPPGTVTFTSDFLDFDQSTARDFAIAINAINPLLVADPSGIAGFAGTASGTFGADAVSGNPAIVPEPASWALMIIGFGMVGGVARRRALVPAAAS